MTKDCPRCKGSGIDPEDDLLPGSSWELPMAPPCRTCAGKCPRCDESLAEYAEDDLVWLTGDDRPYCSHECVVGAYRKSLADPCNWTQTRWPHIPHTWNPEPGMDPAPCPGYPTE